jgi:hypothetical protein
MDLKGENSAENNSTDIFSLCPRSFVKFAPCEIQVNIQKTQNGWLQCCKVTYYCTILSTVI